MKQLVWFLVGLYGVPLVMKYAQALRDRSLNNA